MNRDQFIERWKRHVIGVMALGSSSVRPLTQGTFKEIQEFGNVLSNLNDEAVKLLGQLYDSLKPTVSNGTVQPKEKR